jgi:hypothetical protein
VFFLQVFRAKACESRAQAKGPAICIFTRSPFRINLNLKHLGHHPENWAEYESTVATKKSYFADLVARCNTLHQYWNIDGNVLEFNISREIVEIVIGDLFFRPEDELASAETESEDEIKTLLTATGRSPDSRRMRWICS